MPIAVTCPVCHYSGKVPDQALGRRIKCPKCAKPFLVEADGAAPLPGAAPEPGATPPPQPSSSAFDFGDSLSKPLPLPVPAPPAPPLKESLEPAASDSDEHLPAKPDLPWFYGFLETYTKVAMIFGIVLATIGLLCQLAFSVITLMAGHEGIVLGIIMLVGALIGYLVAILAILLMAAMALTLVDLAKNVREVRRMAQARHGGPAR